MPTLPNSPTKRDPPRVLLSTTRGGSNGYFTFVSTYANVASKTTPATRNPMVKGSLHEVVSACEKPKTSENNPPATRNRPGRSSGSRLAPSSRCNHATVPAVAHTANTRLTKSVHRHDA